MILMGQKIFIRDLIQDDIEDRIRWETIETEWLKWDAPWEMEDEPFDAVKYRNIMNERLSKIENSNRFRYGFQVCVNDETKKHIGWVNAYHIDKNYSYTNNDGKLTIGINIPDTSSRREGYATEAWVLYIKYVLDDGIKEIYTQTWSGNIRVIGLMKKLGFEECKREENIRTVRGRLYDSLTFKLDIVKYKEFMIEYRSL